MSSNSIVDLLDYNEFVTIYKVTINSNVHDEVCDGCGDEYSVLLESVRASEPNERKFE